MEYVSAHGCSNGWLGYQGDHQPLPCLTCRPYLAKTAQVYDCGETKEPVRRHPVEDAWLYAIDAEFVDDNTSPDIHGAPTPVSLHHTTLTIETDSPPWASAIHARSQALVNHINARIGTETVTTITVVTPSASATASAEGFAPYI